jgi:hypothetical protein
VAMTASARGARAPRAAYLREAEERAAGRAEQDPPVQLAPGLVGSVLMRGVAPSASLAPLPSLLTQQSAQSCQ